MSKSTESKQPEPCACPACKGGHPAVGPYPPDYEHVPTVADLAKLGMARQKTTTTFGKWGARTTHTGWEVDAEGSALQQAAQKRNAERCIAFNEQRRSERTAA